MPLYGRILICSALAATVLYFVFHKKRKSRYFCELQEIIGPPLEKVSQIGYFTESATVDLVENVFSVEHNCPTIAAVAGITHCSNVCTQRPDKCSSPAISSVLSKVLSVTEMTGLEAPSLMIGVDSRVIQCPGPTSSESESEHARTPDSHDLGSSPEPQFCASLPPGCFNDPTNDIYEVNPEDVNGTMVPKVLIPSDMWAEAVDKDIWHETFCVPAHMGGVLIGRLGKNVRELRNIWQAEFCLNTFPGRQDTLIFKLSCPIKHKNDVLQWVAKRFRMRPSKTTIGNPDQLKRYLPLGQPIPVHIRSLYASKEIFLSIHDAEYAKYMKMQAEIDSDYASTAIFRMQLCEPVTSGTITIVPHSHGFARALILCVYATWPKTVLYFLLDHGTFGVTPLSKLRKIRAKYMKVRFQAIHVSWAHAFPVFSDIPDIHILRTFFASGRAHAFAVRMETCCRASVAFGEPYCHPYSNHGFLDVLVTASNSGLYMAAPLALYPSRQCWLNGTDTPYYPFSYSAVDYNALVNFLPEDMQQPPTEKVNDYIANSSEKPRYHEAPVFPRKGRSHSGQGSTRRPTAWNQRQCTSGPSPAKPFASQKENQLVITNHASKFDSKTAQSDTVSLKTLSNEVQPRKPLGARNNRPGGVNSRGAYGRGRGSLQSRH